MATSSGNGGGTFGGPGDAGTASDPGLASALVTGIVGLGSFVIGRFIGTPKERAEVKLKAKELEEKVERTDAEIARSFRDELRAEMSEMRARMREMETEQDRQKTVSTIISSRYASIAFQLQTTREQIDELRERAGLGRIIHPPIPPLAVIQDGKIVDLPIHVLLQAEGIIVTAAAPSVSGAPSMTTAHSEAPEFDSGEEEQ